MTALGLAVSLTSPVMLLYLVLLGGWIGLKVLVVLWIKRDAERLGAEARPWWIAAVLLDLVVLLVWLAMRPTPRVRRDAATASAAPGGANGLSPPPPAPRPAPWAASSAPGGARPSSAAGPPRGPASRPQPATRTTPASPGAAARPSTVTVGVRSIRCPSCGNVFPVSVEGAGPTRVKCPDCGAAGTV